MPRRRSTRRSNRNQSAGGFFDFLFGSSSNTEKKNVPENVAEPISMNAPIMNAPAPNMSVPSYNTSNMVEHTEMPANAVGGRRRYKSRRNGKSRKSKGSRRGAKRYTKRR